jgi:hypothetical protein
VSLSTTSAAIHVAPHYLVDATIRRKSGETVDRGIDRMRQPVERHGAARRAISSG